PPDRIGPLPLVWRGPSQLRIQLNHPPRAAAALVLSLELPHVENNEPFNTCHWKIRWTHPEPRVTPLRAGAH
ncbi:hypothetical protein WDW37_17510, partial [Bdellovibrionota bacterium FG-1]